jgi:hypothetical protein
MNAPEEIVRGLLMRRSFERRNLAALRVHSRHDMPDRAVLASSIERLQDNEQSMPFIGIEQMLELAETVQSLLMRLLVTLSSERSVGIAIFQAQLAAWLDDAMFGDIHGFSFSCLIRQCDKGRIYRRSPRSTFQLVGGY